MPQVCWLSSGAYPGIFTMFCPHGTCYGFEVMATYKSPRHPFQITVHSIYIYVAKLIYLWQCLQVTPVLLELGASFLQPHTICWGSLPMAWPYRLLSRLQPSSIAEVRAINSQVNAVLQHIKHTCLWTILCFFICHFFLAVKSIDVYLVYVCVKISLV